MKKISDLEGYVMIDHRASPGVPAKILDELGLPHEAGRHLYEGPTYTCGHCQRQVIVAVGAFGTREKRYVCRGCAHVLCQSCAEEKTRTGICNPFEKQVDELLTAAERRT